MPAFSPRFYVPSQPPALPQPAELPALVTLGHPELAQPSAAVDPQAIGTPAFQERLAMLHWVMLAQRSMGIAAPQVGWFDRHFVMTLPPADHPGSMAPPEPGDAGQPAPVEHWINPEVVSQSQEQAWCWEGCLSVPGFRGWLRRPWAIRVRGFNAQGQAVERDLEGWAARSFQHEIDHLDGLLFPYRAADPRHVVRDEELEHRGSWPKDWPAPGAARQPFGVPLREAAR